MAELQAAFLQQFKSLFAARFKEDVAWRGGQSTTNLAGFLRLGSDHRPAGPRKGEGFELGDAIGDFRGWTIIVEFESFQVSLSNLLKFWPYVRGELSSKPESPIAFFHFSNWKSYATYRDLWEWTLSRMRADPDRLVDIQGCQFNHCGTDTVARAASIEKAFDWLEAMLSVP